MGIAKSRISVILIESNDVGCNAEVVIDSSVFFIVQIPSAKLNQSHGGAKAHSSGQVSGESSQWYFIFIGALAGFVVSFAVVYYNKKSTKSEKQYQQVNNFVQRRQSIAELLEK